MANATQQISELTEEVRHLAEVVAKSVNDNAAGMAEHVGFSPHELRKTARNAGKDVRHFFRARQRQVADARDKYEDVVAEYPLATTAAAVASGLLLGMLLRRK